MKLYITRHGQTEWNIEGRTQGWKNSSLTEKGIDNAKKLGERLRYIDFDCIYSSPLGRAHDTAKHIRGNKNTEIILIENFREMNFGVWEGLKHSEVEKRYPFENYNLLNKPHLYQSIGGENFTELFNRVRIGMNDLMENNDYQNLLLVTHSYVLKAIYAIIRNYSIEEFWNPPFINDTSLTILDITDEKVKIILEADTSHL